MLRKRFFEGREQAIAFYTVTGENSYEPGSPLLLETTGLAKITTPGIMPESGSEPVTAACVVRLKVATGLETLKTGDRFTVQGVTYTVTRLDLSGSLPTDYPMRIEGVLK